MTDRELFEKALDALELVTDLTNHDDEVYEAIEALRARLAQPDLITHADVEQLARIEKLVEDVDPYTAPPQQPERKLWLWKNFVDGSPEYWAFDNPYPTNLDNGDPQTLGQPCGYAIFKPSRDGSCGRTEEQVLREMESVSARSEREWQGLTDEEQNQVAWSCGAMSADWLDFARAIEAKLKEKNA